MTASAFEISDGWTIPPLFETLDSVRHGYRHVRTKVLSPAVSLVFMREPGPPTGPATQEPA
jgi:hypothetical protein